MYLLLRIGDFPVSHVSFRGCTLFLLRENQLVFGALLKIENRWLVFLCLLSVKHWDYFEHIHSGSWWWVKFPLQLNLNPAIENQMSSQVLVETSFFKLDFTWIWHLILGEFSKFENWMSSHLWRLFIQQQHPQVFHFLPRIMGFFVGKWVYSISNIWIPFI